MTAFLTRLSKNRQTFLELLRAGPTPYVVNAEALAAMRGRNLSKAVIDQLAEGPRHVPDAAHWPAHLSALRLDQARGQPDPVRRDCRDGVLGLMTTCDKPGVWFWDSLGDRLAIPDVPPLPDLIRARAPT